MSALPLVASLLGIIFFIGGCLQIAMYVGAVPMEPFSVFFPGLVSISWPLAVAAVIFALVDIRLNLISLAQTRRDDDDIHEAPVRRAQARKKSSGGSGNFSYFAAQPPAEPEAPAPAAQTQLVSPQAVQTHIVPPPVAQTRLVTPQAPQAQPIPPHAAQSTLFATPPPFHTPQDNHPPAAPAAPTATPAPQEEKTEDEGLNFFKL